jgi:serine/threonine protein kinase
LEDCKEALGELHASGLLHGDLVKDNILITSEGPKFIDFEDSTPQPCNDLERWNAMKEQELCSLEAALLDSSGRGRPWD